MRRISPVRKIQAGPIITLLTDFGARDGYVAALKGELLSLVPGLIMVDVTHGIPAQDVQAGAWVLRQAWRSFPAGTVHLAVVDPGAGSRRRFLTAMADDHYFFAPDNGLLSWVEASALRFKVRTLRLGGGWDNLVGAAARFAAGRVPWERLGPAAKRFVRMDHVRPRRMGSRLQGRIVHVDGFGNLVTNLALPPGASGAVSAGDFTLGLQPAYAAAAPGEPLAMIGSEGTVEIAVRDGNAALALGLRRGDPVGLQLLALGRRLRRR